MHSHGSERVATTRTTSTRTATTRSWLGRRLHILATGLTAAVLVALIIPPVGTAAATSSVTSLASWSRGYSAASYQETSTRIAYNGPWTRAKYSGYSGGYARAATIRNAGATFTFTGTGVAWVGPVGPTRGSAKIYLDGKYVKTVSTYASRFQAARVLYTASYSRVATHKLVIVVQGTAGRPMVAIDRFVVRGSAKPATTVKPATTGGSFYGPGIAADTLANTQVGGTSCGCPNLMSSYRFRAGQSARLSAIRIYVVGVGNSGYAGGSGGTISFSIQKDDGSSAHRPSGTSLASVSVAGKSLGDFPTIKFASAATLTKGQLYHVVFRNTDPSPRSNFISIDGLAVETGVLVPRQPKYSDVDWAQLMNAGSGWKVRPEYTPIMQLEYSNGAVEGVGYMEVWVGDPKRIGGAAKVRQVIAVSGGDRTVDSVTVRVRRTSGTGALTVRLETAGGTLIESGTVAAGPTSMAWRTLTFDRVRVLQSGSTYNVVLSAPSGTTYTTFAVRQGTSYGFHGATYFTAGRMQYTTSSTWVNAESWGDSSTEGDLQFYFH